MYDVMAFSQMPCRSRFTKVKNQSVNAMQESIDNILEKYRERPFVEKLWAVVADPKLRAFKWTENGKSILIDFMALDDYLFSDITIFDIPDRVEFFSALKLLDFKRVDTKKWDTNKAVVDEYEHSFFQRDDEAALKNFTKTLVSEYQETNDLLSSQRTDPCFQPIRRMSALHEARLRFQMVMDMALMTKAIEKGKVETTEEHMLTVSPGVDAVFEIDATTSTRPLKDDIIPLDKIQPAPDININVYDLLTPEIANFLNRGASSSKCTNKSSAKDTSDRNLTGKYGRCYGGTKSMEGRNPASLNAGMATQSAMGLGASDGATQMDIDAESNQAIEKMPEELLTSSDDDD